MDTHLIKQQLILLMISLLVSKIICVDYCRIEKEKCRRPVQQPHIGCNETALTFEVNQNCTNIKITEFSNNDKNYILKLHNELRDKLAAGKVENYPSGSRMLEMYWDQELEATACEHVKYCQFEHDKCRATESYELPGQNIRIAMYLNFQQSNITKILYEGVMDWFQEYKDVESDIVDRYESRPNHKQYGHFTVMSKDNNDRVGCCHITYEEELSEGDIAYSHLFTCNYRETNLIGRQIYEKGEPASRCQDFGVGYAQSGNYEHLCTDYLTVEDLNLINEVVVVEEEEEDDDIKYCKIGQQKCGRKKHIGCKDNSGFDVNLSCQNIHVHNMTDVYKSTILKEHNKYRDLIASGQYNEFPPASKMLKMEWDTELEEVACKHVQYCQLHPDQCHATKKYDAPGQSLYQSYSTRKHDNHIPILKQAVKSWFEQSNVATPAVIDEFNPVGPEYYGGFTLMVKEDNDRIGCCFITYEENVNEYLWNNHLVTCNYNKVIFLQHPVYTKGVPGEKCNEWGDEYETSNLYTNLCTQIEDNNHNGDYDLDSQTEIPLNLSQYCELEMKKCDGSRHIGCETDPGLELNKQCKDIQRINMTNDMIETVLYTHNEFRNQIASGTVEGYPSASKMLQMEWDTELENVACEHVQKCQFKYDECRATESYNDPGQSISLSHSFHDITDYPFAIRQAIEKWFIEHKQVNPDIIDSFEIRPPAVYDHFTMMIKESNNKIGCCHIKYRTQLNGHLWYSHLFTCDYKENNVLNSKTYTVGEPTSQCYEWGLEYKTSDDWNNLCVIPS